MERIILGVPFNQNLEMIMFSDKSINNRPVVAFLMSY